MTGANGAPSPGAGSAPTAATNEELASATGYVLCGIALQAVVTLLIVYVASPWGAAWSGWGILSVLCGAGAIFLLLAYFGAYLPVQQGRLAVALPVLMVLGILGLPLGLVFVGVVYLLAWRKVSSVRSAQVEARATSFTLSTSLGAGVPTDTRPPPLTSERSPPVVYRTPDGTPLGRCPACGAERTPGRSPCLRCGAP